MAAKKPAYQKKYYDVTNASSYLSKTKLLASLAPQRRSEAAAWLTAQPAYLMHRRAPKKFKRLKVIAAFQQQIHADLVDVSDMANANAKVKYLLTAIEPFSKRAWIQPLLRKDGGSVTAAFEKILDGLNFKPIIFFSDQGKEFLNSNFRTLLKKRNIDLRTSKDADVKGSVIERFNQTVLTKVHKYLTREKTNHYLDVLPDILKNYNETPHSATGLAPNRITHRNKEKVWLRLHKAKSRERTKRETRFRLGDTVLIPKRKKPFSKGYHGAWTGEIFKVSKIRNTIPVTYNLQDLDGDEIVGIFYGPELQKIVPPSVYPIETVLDKKKDKILVKWLYYPKKFNSWISVKDLK